MVGTYFSDKVRLTCFAFPSASRWEQLSRRPNVGVIEAVSLKEQCLIL